MRTAESLLTYWNFLEQTLWKISRQQLRVPQTQTKTPQCNFQKDRLYKIKTNWVGTFSIYLSCLYRTSLKRLSRYQRPSASETLHSSHLLDSYLLQAILNFNLFTEMDIKLHIHSCQEAVVAKSSVVVQWQGEWGEDPAGFQGFSVIFQVEKWLERHSVHHTVKPTDFQQVCPAAWFSLAVWLLLGSFLPSLHRWIL